MPMKPRSSARAKPDVTMDKRVYLSSASTGFSDDAGVPSATLRKLDEIAKDIAGLRVELAKAVERSRQPAARPRPAS